MKIPLLFFAVSFSVNSIAQTYTIELHQNNRAASLLMSSNDYDSFKTSSTFRTSATKVIAQDIYQEFKDDFDFIFLILNEDNIPSGLPYAWYTSVSNDVSGIGGSIFDETADYGSSGKLKGVLTLTRRNLLVNGPSLHEIMHKWGNFSIKTEVTTDGITFRSPDPHWGFTGGSTKGQLGGFQQSTLVDNGNNSYSVGKFACNANGGNLVPYNELELYLMGMIPISDVKDFDVFTGISNYNSSSVPYTFNASTRTTYTSASLGALLGERDPSHLTSQKDFKALIAVLTAAPLTADQWKTVDDQAEKFGRPSSDGTNFYNFWEATRGKGTLETGNLQNSLNQVAAISKIENGNLNVHISVSPNPATISVSFKTRNQITIKELLLYNSTGRNVGEFSAGTNQSNVNIYVGNYPPGIYSLRVVGDGHFMRIKRVVID